MAKVCKFLAEYREKIESIGIECSEDQRLTKIYIKKFLKLAKEQVEDVRMQGKVMYPVEEIILLAFLTVLGNAATWVEMERFGNEKIRWLRKFSKFENGIPSHDTIRRVFGLLKTADVQALTVNYLLSHLEGIRKALNIQKKAGQYSQTCVDGKEQRGTGRKSKGNVPDLRVRNLQTLHVYDASQGICLVSEGIKEKTNEIPTAQEVLGQMNLKDVIVSFDALNTQKETIAVIRGQKGHYIGGLKGNHSDLMEFTETLFADEDIIKECKEKGWYDRAQEKAHDQIELRETFVYQIDKPSSYAETKNWKGLKCLVMQKKTLTPLKGEKTEPTVETRYYITSLDPDAELIADGIRGHWMVESFHNALDTAFFEDDNTTMDKAAFNNLSLLNKMALTLYKLAKPVYFKKSSIRVIRKQFAWSFEEHITQLFTLLDEQTLSEALMAVKA